MPHITAIVIAYNSENLILDCVRAALGTSISRLLVWDNAPDRGSIKALASVVDDRLHLLSKGRNLGFGSAINQAYSAYSDTDTDQILLINPDCFVDDKVVDALSEAVMASDVGIAAPRMTYKDGSQGIAGGPYPTLLKEVLAKMRVDELLPPSLKKPALALFRSKGGGASLRDSLVSGEDIDMDWVSGFCMMIRADLFSAINGFDDDFFLYFEDVDICRRAANRGFKVRLIRRVSALHLESTSTGPAGKSNHYYNGLSTYLRKHAHSKQLFLARAFGLVK